MAASFGRAVNAVQKRVREAITSPQFTAMLPAVAFGAYWMGGETLLFFLALAFPALMLAAGVMTQPTRPGGFVQDSVTGLPLRDTALRQLELGIHDAGNGPIDRVAVAVAIDDWPQLRKRHDPETCDEILRKYADRLRDALRPNDLVASLGDGRFALVLKGHRRLDLEAMIQLSGRVQEATGQPMALDEAQILVTTGVGFCLPSRAPDQTGEASLMAAESALSEALASGPGSIRSFSNRTQIQAPAARFGEDEVREALENGQITPWFQPQVSTDTGEVTGFEALARWEHPDRGQIAPAAFLGVIAKGGMFDRLGELMLYGSLTALRDWDRAGLYVPGVAVNLSAQELRNPKLFDRIRWELDRFELEPGRLTIEILETVAAGSPDDTAIRNIAALSALGCRIDLDDFGTGHASITNIRRFDVHRIKIDRSFVTHVDTDREQQDMVAAILTMADRLGIETLAEGVESLGEHSMLAQLGCGHVQGYSIGKPMPFCETGAWIAEHRSKMVHATVLQDRA